MAEQESRDDPVSRIMNAAWPEYGGNHQTIDFWNDFGEGVQFTLKHQEATDGWQPIETAKRDGTQLLLAAEFAPGDWRVKTGGFDVVSNCWHLFGASWQPTLWAPIPPIHHTPA